MQKALNSGAETVVIDRQPSDWIVTPIVISATNLTIVAEDGVVVRAKKGAFKGVGDSLFRFSACKNVEFRGEGRVKLVMNKADYQNYALYKPAEWRMCIAISRWSDGMTFRNLECWSSGGDGFYVGQGRNILAEDLRCLDNHRQGMSIISCENLVCRRCLFNQTEGTAPRCGLDIEPDGPTCLVSGVLFEDCEFNDNRCSGVLCYLNTLNGRSRPVDITFRRCRASHNGMAAYAVTAAADHNLGPGKPGPVKGRILFENCYGFANGNAVRAHGMVPGGIEVVFRNVEINARGKEAFVFSGSSVYDFSNMAFDNVRIDTDLENPIAFSPLPGAGASGLKGKVVFVDSGKNERTVDMAAWAAKQPKDPDLFNFPTAAVDFNAIRAAGTKTAAKPLSTGLITSRSFQLVQVAPAAGEYPIEFDVVPYYKDSAPGRIEVQCRDKLGTDLGVLKFGMGKSVHRMSVTGPNVHTFQVSMKGDVKVAVRSAHPGFGLVASGKVRSFGAPGKRYFSVPADAEEVRVEIVGKSGAKLFDAAGKVVAEKPYDERNAMLLVKRSKSAKGEIWCLDIDKVFWDVTYRIAEPCLPVLSPSPEQAVVMKK